MDIQCTDKKTFELIKGSQKLGKLTYESLFSFKAHLQVENNTYKIAPKGLFSTQISVSQNDTEIASMKITFHGGIALTFANGKEFILKAKGVFHANYILEDENQQQLLVLHPDFKWTKLSYNYSVSYDQPQDPLLVLLTTYAANYYIAVMSSSIY
ncbi:MAG: hypothetical protein WCY89_09805 [Flavobacteriaceae bacterium]